MLVLTYGMREEAFWINSAQESIMDSCRSSLVCSYWWVMLEVGDAGEPDRVDSSCVSVCISCGLWDWRERQALVWALWDLLTTVDSLVRLVLWGLETLSFFT